MVATHKENCNYEKEKPERDRIRTEIWKDMAKIDSKIETVGETIKSLNASLTAQLNATADYNEEQDKRSEELKETVHELSAIVQEIAAQQTELKKEISGMRAHIDNGWKKDLIEKQAQRTDEQLQMLFEMIRDLTAQIIKLQSIKEESKNKKGERWKSIGLKFLEIILVGISTGGIFWAFFK